MPDNSRRVGATAVSDAFLATQSDTRSGIPVPGGGELETLDIPQVCFAHSNLDRAHLTGGKLGGATLSDALLRGTDLSGADLRGADLTRADLDGAILLGADLTNAELGDASLRGVITDNTTTWPAGFTPPEPDAGLVANAGEVAPGGAEGDERLKLGGSGCPGEAGGLQGSGC